MILGRFWFSEVLVAVFSTKTRVLGMMRCPNILPLKLQECAGGSVVVYGNGMVLAQASADRRSPSTTQSSQIFQLQSTQWIQVPKNMRVLCWGFMTMTIYCPGQSAELRRRLLYPISQIAPLPLAVALSRSSKSQIAARHAAFWHAIPQIAFASLLWCPKSQRFKSQRLQDANGATKSQPLPFCESQRCSATELPGAWGAFWG